MTDPARCLLDQFGVLAIDGPDAAAFLQGQATCDTRLLSPARGALGALCNLQGRMIVSFYVLPLDGGLRLVMPRDRIDAVLAHLKKYAVFSRVLLADDTATHVAAGGTGAAGEPWSVALDGGLPVMALRGGRTIGLAPAGSLAADAAGAVRWQAAAIDAGELLVDGAHADRFLPQALNYDVIDGVSFRKGCYTGQEVVARMHFKGRMKERLYVGSAATATPPPVPAVVAGDGGKPVGEVVAATASEGRCLVAAILRHEAARDGALHLPDGTPLAIGAQPYPIPDAG